MIETLLRASIDGAVAATVVWVICRFVPSLPAAARAMLWWCAAAKFVVALVWVTPIALPILPAQNAIVPMAATATLADPTTNPTSNSVAAINLAATTLGLGPWALGLFALWLFGVSISLTAAVRQWRRARVMLRDASPAPDDLIALTAELSARAGLAAPPPVWVSPCVRTPLVVGVRRSVVVLPASVVAAMPTGDQRMAISHELAHIRRGDLRWGCVPALAEALFFFHPLAHVAAREYALWREAACDAAVLDVTGAAPEEYARLLLGLGVTRPRAGLAAAGASESFSNLKRRLVMLHTTSPRSTSSRLLAGAFVGLAALAIVPVQLTARATTTLAEIHTPAKTAAPEPAAPQTTVERRTERRGGPTFVFFRDDVTHLMDGSREDLRRAERLRQGNEELLWVRQDGREYISRDGTLLRQLRELWQPVTQLGEEQSKIGEQQSKLGEQQSEVGERQSRLGLEQSKIGIQQSEIGLEMSQMARQERRLSDAERQKLEDMRAKLDVRMKELDLLIADLDKKMRELERPMDALGAQMDKLGDAMDGLGQKMDAASKRAEQGTRELIDRAIASGTLQPVK